MGFTVKNVSSKLTAAEKQYLKASNAYEEAVRLKADSKALRRLNNKMLTAKHTINFYRSQLNG